LVGGDGAATWKVNRRGRMVGEGAGLRMAALGFTSQLLSSPYPWILRICSAVTLVVATSAPNLRALLPTNGHRSAPSLPVHRREQHAATPCQEQHTAGPPLLPPSSPRLWCDSAVLTEEGPERLLHGGGIVARRPLEPQVSSQHEQCCSQTEEQRIIREEANKLTRISNVKRTLRSKSGCAPRCSRARTGRGTRSQRPPPRRRREVHVAAAQPRAPGPRGGGQAAAHQEPRRVPRQPRGQHAARRRRQGRRRQQPRRREEHPAGPVRAVAVVPGADVLRAAPRVGFAVDAEGRRGRRVQQGRQGGRRRRRRREVSGIRRQGVLGWATCLTRLALSWSIGGC